LNNSSGLGQRIISVLLFLALPSWVSLEVTGNAPRPMRLTVLKLPFTHRSADELPMLVLQRKNKVWLQSAIPVPPEINPKTKPNQKRKSSTLSFQHTAKKQLGG